MSDKTVDQIAAEAWDKIRDATSLGNANTSYFVGIIKAAIEKATVTLAHAFESERELRKRYEDEIIELKTARQLRAAQASEQLYCDICGTELQRESCNHVRPCPKCCPPAQASERVRAIQGDIYVGTRFIASMPSHEAANQMAETLNATLQPAQESKEGK